MKEVPGELVKERPDLKEGEVYTILNAELTTTSVRSFQGVRVVVEPDLGERFGIMLWIRPAYSARSKIGAFVKLLGKNLEAWKGKRIRVLRWRPGNREIELVESGK